MKRLDAASRLRLVALGAALTLLVAAWQSGLLALFSDLTRTRETLRGLGPWGYLGFVTAYTALQPIGVPGTVFVMAAPLVWPWPVAFALSMVGTMGASVVGFSFARYIARDAVSARIPARLRRYDEALATRGFATVAFLRFVFWMPQLLHTFLGVSRVSFGAHFWGSVVGYALPLLAVSYYGEAAFARLRALSRGELLGLVAATALVALGVTLWRRSARRRAGPA